MAEYLSNEEIRRIDAEGKAFAKRVGNELADYVIEAAQRATTAGSQHTLNEDIAREGFHKPNEAFRSAVAEEYDLASRQLEGALTAAEALLQINATN